MGSQANVCKVVAVARLVEPRAQIKGPSVNSTRLFSLSYNRVVVQTCEA